MTPIGWDIKAYTKYVVPRVMSVSNYIGTNTWSRLPSRSKHVYIERERLVLLEILHCCSVFIHVRASTIPSATIAHVRIATSTAGTAARSLSPPKMSTKPLTAASNSISRAVHLREY